MSDLSRGHNDAHSAWLSPFQFEPSNGGLGIAFTVTTTSQRAALIGAGYTLMVTNDGPVRAHLALGGSSVIATTSYMALLPGTSQCFTIKPDDSITHAAVITASGSTSVQITRGNGG